MAKDPEPALIELSSEECDQFLFDIDRAQKEGSIIGMTLDEEGYTITLDRGGEIENSWSDE